MDRTVYIEIAGKQYPMRFSVGASIAITKKFGSLQKMADNLKKGDDVDEEKAFETIIWMAETLIRQGCAYKNLFESDLPIPENAPVKDGKYMPLTAENLEIALDMADMGEITKKIFAAIGSGNKKEIHTKEKENSKKNEKEAI